MIPYLCWIPCPPPPEKKKKKLVKPARKTQEQKRPCHGRSKSRKVAAGILLWIGQWERPYMRMKDYSPSKKTRRGKIFEILSVTETTTLSIVYTYQVATRTNLSAAKLAETVPWPEIWSLSYQWNFADWKPPSSWVVKRSSNGCVRSMASCGALAKTRGTRQVDQQYNKGSIDEWISVWVSDLSIGRAGLYRMYIRRKYS